MKDTVTVLGSIVLAMTMFLVGPHGQRNDSHAQTPDKPSESQIAEESRLTASLIELFQQKKFNEALAVGTQLLDLRQKMFGPDHPAMASSLSNLGEIYIARNDNDKADSVYRRAVAILQNNPEANLLLLSRSLERLAVIRYKKHDYRRAAEFLEQAVIVNEKAVGKEDLSTAVLIHNLANVYQGQNRVELAEQLYVRSLTIMEQKLGKDHPDTISKMKDYACLSYNQISASFLKSRKPKPDEPEKPHKALRDRASCWLFGFDQDCAVERPEVSYALGDVLNGKAISLPKPNYPAEARRERAHGQVIVAVHIDEQGKVIKAKAICGGPQTLHDASLSSALASRFTPTKVKGQPSKVSGVITYNYVIQ